MLRVFSQARYIVLALISALLVLVAITIAWNYRFFLIYLSDPAVTFSDALVRTTSLFSQFFVSLLFDNHSLALVAALLMGVYVALLVAHVRTQRKLPTSGTLTGLAGVVVGVLGSGCAACGTLVLSALFSGTTGIALALSRYTGMLQWLGVLILALGIMLLARTINKPAVCKV
jgi:hypothetical protein